MSSFSWRRLLATALWVSCVVTLSACTDDQKTCEDGDRCALGQVCQDGKCVLELFECDATSDENTCGAGRYCSEETFSCRPGCGKNSECASTEICSNNQCVTKPNCDADEECGLGEYCNEDKVCAPVGLQCREPLETCVPGVRTRDGFVCTNLGQGAKCYSRCEARELCTPQLNQNTNMPASFFSTERVCPDGSYCVNNTACQPSECEGPVRGKATCDAKFPETGGSCVQRTTNNVNYPERYYICEKAGGIEDGQPCGSTGAIGGGDTCRAGRTCVGQIGLFNLTPGGTGPQPFCAKACRRDLDCGVTERCVGEDEGTFGGAGVCTERCDPFKLDVDQCSEGKKCFAISSEDGICTDLIAPGKKAAYDSCGGDTECPSGTLCVSGQCLPHCDPTLPSREERDASCEGGNTKAYVKVLHLAQGAGAVDVYVDGEKLLNDFEFDKVAEGEKGRFYELAPGEHVVQIYAATDEDRDTLLTTSTFMMEGNKAYYVSALLSNDATTPVQLVAFGDERVAPDPSSAQKAVLRVVHAVEGAGKVDIVATAANADVAIEANQTVLASDLDFGAATDYTEIDAGAYDIYIFTAGGVRTELTAAAVFKNIMPAAETQFSAVAYGNVGQNNPRTPGLKNIAHKLFTYIPTSGGYCYNLAPGNGQDTTPSWGICFQECKGGAQAYGKGLCDGDGPGACQPFGTDISVCFEKGLSKLGEACIEDGCVDGTFCDFKGDGNGVCRSYCTLNGIVNPNLAGCDAAQNETCMPSSLISGLGECRIACTPDTPGSFKSSSCPAGQQTCRPDDGNYYCQPSGMVAVGDECTPGGEALSDDCVSGSMCTREVLVPDTGFTRWIEAFLGPDANESGICRPLCRPFLPEGESDCPADLACAPVLPTQDLTTLAGICLPRTEVAADDTCAEVSRMCGDGAICTTQDETPNTTTGLCEVKGSCLRLCDPTTKLGCPSGQRCRELGSTDNRSLVFGVYGICRDE